MAVPQWKKKALAKKRNAIPRKMRGLLRGRIGRGLRQPVQFFKRSKWISGWLNAPLGSQTSFSLEPILNAVPNYTEFTALYDQYQIKGVKITLFPKFSQVAGVELEQGGPIPGSFAQNLMGQVSSIIDYDGVGTVPLGMNDIVQYQNLKITRGNKLHSRYFRPAIAANVFRTGTAATSGYATARNKWLDCTYADITHYGLYGVVDMTNLTPSYTSSSVSYDLKVDYYLAFKNVR